VDEKTYGNDSRFCRRASSHNAELRHVVDKGSLHLFIVAVKSVDKNQEILLPLEGDTLLPSPSAAAASLPSIHSDVREMKKPANGLVWIS
jgi:histone-lysine N-methyltransferase MLL5